MLHGLSIARDFAISPLGRIVLISGLNNLEQQVYKLTLDSRFKELVGAKKVNDFYDAARVRLTQVLADFMSAQSAAPNISQYSVEDFLKDVKVVGVKSASPEEVVLTFTVSAVGGSFSSAISF